MRRRPHLVALVVVLALVAAACGQKEGVHVATSGGGGGDLNSGGFVEDGDGGGTGLDDGGGDTGTTGGDTGGGDTGGGDTGGTAGGGGTTPGRTRGGTTGGDGSTGGGSPPAAGSGGKAWGSTIVIGVHAPITGAAPLPSSFRAAAELYGNYVNSKGGINGRKVVVKVADDEYQPSVAVTRCRELVQRDNAFLLVGGGGTDQIQACARYAESAGVPYLSAGVTEIGLRGLKGYFAVSMSYKQQGPYLANLIKQKFRDRAGNAAMVYSDTPNFRDARDGFMGAMGAGTAEYKLDRVPSSTQLANVARQMCVDGVQVAYPLMAPKDWLIMLRNVTCDIQWAGVGLTMGLNTVASTGCKDTPGRIDGAVFFSPFPGIDRAEGMDPQFKEAVAGRNWDDIYVALFSVNRAIGELLRRSGQSLTRAGFVQTASTAKNIATGLHPPLNYSPDDHFGAQTVHLLQVRCQGSGGQYVTVAVNAKF